MKESNWRFLHMILVGVLIAFLLGNLNQDVRQDQNALNHYLVTIVITILVWEGNLRLDNLMNKYFPWVTKPLRRLLVHLPASVIYSSGIIYICMQAYNAWICELPEAAHAAMTRISMLVGVLITFIILSLEISTQFFRQWKSSLVEIEKYKAENLQAQLENLKNQLNPHFLFNNMSVLSSLVYKDQDKAVDFINQLSKVYRYLLDNRNNELVDLETELNFINSYIYLLQIRFDKNLKFEIDLPKENLKSLLPPLSLQMLIENAIKHNEVSDDQPLTISISIKDQMIEVSNNLQKRTVHEVSSKTGIQNIKERYKYFTDRAVEVIENISVFTIRIPLLIGK